MDELGHVLRPLQSEQVVVGIHGFSQYEFAFEAHTGSIGSEPDGVAVRTENRVQIVVRIAPQRGVVIPEDLVLVEVGLSVFDSAPNHGQAVWSIGHGQDFIDAKDFFLDRLKRGQIHGVDQIP